MTNAVRSGQAWLWLGFGLALGCGILLKGPVALVYALPPLFACKWWAPAGAPAFRVLDRLALALAVMVPIAWLAAASLHGSREYMSTLLIDQTMDRISGEMGHPRPWYWYLPIMLLLPMPWALWWPAVRTTAREMLNSEDRGNRFVLSILIPGLLVLSAAGGKQVHYLIPLLAVLMLLVSRGLHDPGVSTRRRHSLVPALLMSPLVLPGIVVLIGTAGPQFKPWLPVFRSEVSWLWVWSPSSRCGRAGGKRRPQPNTWPSRASLSVRCGGRSPSDHSVPGYDLGRLAGTSVHNSRQVGRRRTSAITKANSLSSDDSALR
ncbi:MAG: hypothetical protein IPJ97_17680 [Proteobacteria bacterium]|nr:hypothetical protein [Pseudomonadota bacterium]